ncbi:MAG: LytR C-terminal domain-containing protein [Candidatus Berkelbacteria bacterium]|nr:LytR C-terminal domain-containing protein [Candidatus Berkelbacteria bacterium]
MGIADDIRPKKFQRVSDRREKKSKAEKDPKEEAVHELFSKKDSGDFFADTPIGEKTPAKAKVETKTKDIGQEKKGFGWFYTTIIILVILILATILIWQNFDTLKSYWNGSHKNKKDANLNQILNSNGNSSQNYSGSTTTTPTTTQPTTTTSPTVDKSFPISVLNGSGIKNSAASVSSELTTAGFTTVTNSGNARSFSYSSTVVYFKTGKDVEADLVKTALPDQTVTATESNSVVGANYDIVVVVGKK